MKKIFYTILGFILSVPIMMSDALGISLDDFKNEVFRPENLPGGDMGSSSAENKIADIVNFMIDLILYASGAVSVLMLVLGAVWLITAHGNADQKGKAVKIITYAVVGLFVVILAYAVVTNVINFIFKATT
jgi:uncharacterized membrane protein YhdT